MAYETGQQLYHRVELEGRVEALTYEEQQAPRGSWLTRLLG